LIVVALIAAGVTFLGTDIMPPSGSRDIQVRIISPEGTSLEKSEENMLAVEQLLRDETGNAVVLTSAFVGMHSPNTPINPIFLFTAGSHEAVLQATIDTDVYEGSLDDLKERIRHRVAEEMSGVRLIFEPVEMIEKIMNQGANTPIAVKVAGRNLQEANAHARKIRDELRNHPKFRDVTIAEPVDYPTIKIEVDRERAVQFGLNMEDVSYALTTATSSSRFTNKNLWVDPKSGLVFQTQVQVPEREVQSINALRALPLKSGSARPVLEDVAEITFDKQPGQVNRQGPNRYVTLIANVHNSDLGSAA